MTDTKLKETFDENMARLKANLAADALKTETLGQNVWQRWEPYLCLGVGLVAGFLLGHFL